MMMVRVFPKRKRRSKNPERIKVIKTFWGLNFFLTFLIILFLPGQNYYDNLTLSQGSPRVLASHFSIPHPSPLPKNVTGNTAPLISARAALVVDVPSGVILYEKNKDLRLPPASTTKMMSAQVALGYYQPSKILEVPDIFPNGQNIKLQKGEKLEVETLLYGLLVASANDAAETLAENFPGGRGGFIEAMNRKAQELNLSNTHFVNPTGIDEEGQYTSAFDLFLLAKAVLQNPLLVKIVGTSEIVLYSYDKEFTHPVSNINTLLKQDPRVKGIKTGWTLAAGECFVGLAEENGRQVITVVLGSQDRFGDTEKLLDWVFGNFQWVIPE